jgi:hypothetical protein
LITNNRADICLTWISLLFFSWTHKLVVCEAQGIMAIFWQGMQFPCSLLHWSLLWTLLCW